MSLLLHIISVMYMTCGTLRDFPLWETILAAVFTFAIVCIIIGLLVYRRMKLEAALANMSWKVRWEDIKFTKPCRTSMMMSRLSIGSISSLLDPVGVGGGQQFVLIGHYKGNVVAVKRLQKHKRIELARAVLIELKQMREALHDNIARFVGACIDPPNVSVLTEYCPKGSLYILNYINKDTDYGNLKQQALPKISSLARS
ncbi:atrial natriuretic peptide receptor 2-like [Tachypleus tridentatus]|uniref:atrial natriuretic peptide receptor 2-like n=1 Tax=Tachypleus tridentatus TaxID=6853 RepID=UPI003FCFF4BB